MKMVWHAAGLWLVFCAVSVRAADPAPPVPDAVERSRHLIQNQPVTANPSVFSGAAFPKIDFLNKDLVAAALGPYALKTRFFDAGWSEVTAPTSAGRYGAVIDITFQNGLTETRQVTLFKTAAPYVPAKDPYRVTVVYPAAFGLPASVVDREGWNSGDFFGRMLGDFEHWNNDSAVIVAALHDAAADPVRWHGFNYWVIEDEWWEGLADKLGAAKEYQRLVRLPDDYDKEPGKKWPLLLFLHGSGERGDDLQRVKAHSPILYIEAGHPLPFIVAAPQCPKGEWWHPGRLLRLIDSLEADYRIDPKRVYVTGLSMGGYGTFDLAAAHPDRFAAIAPLSGGENPAIAERLRRTPTWIFHGVDDAGVPARYSIDIAAAMKQLGAPVKLTLYPGGHGGWEKVYADPALYAWFLQYSR